MKALKTVCMLEYIGKQIQKWRDHVNRMVRRRIPKQILLCACLQADDLQDNWQKKWLKTITDLML